MGHMEADNRLTTEFAGCDFSSPVMISFELDPNLQATSALSQFGCGLIEVGPYDFVEFQTTVPAESFSPKICHDELDWKSGKLTTTDSRRCWQIDRVLIQGVRSHGTKIALRVVVEDGKPLQNHPLAARNVPSYEVLEHFFLATHEDVDVYLFDLRMETTNLGCFLDLLFQVMDGEKRRFPCCTIQIAPTQIRFAIDLISKMSESKVGLVINTNDEAFQDSLTEDANRILGPGRVMTVKQIDSPGQALSAFNKGAAMVAVGSGFAFTGPGLAKRIQAAELNRRMKLMTQEKVPSPRVILLADHCLLQTCYEP